MQNNITIDIISPIFNDEKYICECVESVKSQKYQNFEALLVDDGSNDDSAAICEENANLDSRFIVVHKKNRGVSSARECGGTLVRGEYAMFLDADDWLDDNCLSKCAIAIQENNNPDCIMFTFVRENQISSREVHLFDGNKVFEEEEIVEKVHHRFFGMSFSELKHPERMDNISTCWGKCYRKDVLYRGKYFEIKTVGSSEDALFNIYSLDKFKNIVYLDECLIHYRKHLGTVTSSYRPKLKKQCETLFQLFNTIIEINHYPKIYSEALCSRVAISIVTLGLNELRGPGNSRDYIRFIRNYLRSDLYSENCKKLKIKNMPFLWKLFMVCCKLKMTLPVCFMIWCVSKIHTQK